MQMICSLENSLLPAARLRFRKAQSDSDPSVWWGRRHHEHAWPRSPQGDCEFSKADETDAYSLSPTSALLLELCLELPLFHIVSPGLGYYYRNLMEPKMKLQLATGQLNLLQYSPMKMRAVQKHPEYIQTTHTLPLLLLAIPPFPRVWYSRKGTSSGPD